MSKIKGIIQFIKDNPYLSLIGSIMLVMLIFVAISKKDLNRPAQENYKEIYYMTEDFTVSYMPNGDIVVSTRNPDLKDLNIIKRTLNLPSDANVILDIPGAISSNVETDTDEISDEELMELTDMDLSSVGD